MDQRMFSFEYRKPRYANPTFLSSNVGFSLRAYNPEEPSLKNKITSYQKDYQKSSQPTLILPKLNNLRDNQSHFSLPKIQKVPQINVKQYSEIKSNRNSDKNELTPNKFFSQELLKDKADQLRKNQIIRESQSAKKKVQFFQKQQQQMRPKQDMPIENSEKYHQIQRQKQVTKIQQQKQRPLQRIQNNEKNLNHNPSHNLLKIIQDRKVLLNKLKFTQKDINRKQLTSYNIINLQPKQYDQTIKQYPKLTLQDKDEYFGRRFQKSLQDKNLYESRYANIHPHDNLQGEKISINIYKQHPINHVSKNSLPIAGVHTYKVHEEPHINDHQQVQQFQPHVHKNDQHFNMKLLNIVDQWTN